MPMSLSKIWNENERFRLEFADFHAQKKGYECQHLCLYLLVDKAEGQGGIYFIRGGTITVYLW
jgi:hypothetical protein